MFKTKNGFDLLDSEDELIYDKPYNQLIFSKRNNGGILIRCVQYLNADNYTPEDSTMFFFTEDEKDVLRDWLTYIS